MTIFIDYKVNNGKYNMQLDAQLLDKSIKTKQNETILRFYGWSPSCVSIGRNQNPDDINTDYCKENKIDIVRRITGGRALYHSDEVTYSFICPMSKLKNGESVINSYKEISEAIIEGFKLLGIELNIGNKKQNSLNNKYCMLLSTGADLCWRNKKLIGSAQYRQKDYILQHGSILFSYDKEKLKNIFKEDVFSTDLITSIKDINSEITYNDVIESMKKGFKIIF